MCEYNGALPGDLLCERLQRTNLKIGTSNIGTAFRFLSGEG
jgi:hypothetical protein